MFVVLNMGNLFSQENMQKIIAVDDRKKMKLNMLTFNLAIGLCELFRDNRHMTLGVIKS